MIDALDAMRAGIVELDAKAIRKAASKAKAVVQTLAPRRETRSKLPLRSELDLLEAGEPALVEHRIADKRMLRLIAKWLKVGIIEDGRVTRSQCGAPQGAVISPTLANVYLHYAYDLWVQKWRQTKANGDMIVVRFADDRAPRRREEEVTM